MTRRPGGHDGASSQSKGRMAVNDIFFGEYLVRFDRKSVADGAFGEGTRNGCAGKVLQVSNRDAVVWNEVEAVDVGGNLFGSGEDCARFLDLDAEAMVMEMALEPVVTVITISQKTKVADFHDPVS